ncbi:MAG: cell division protein SepF [Clostridia bacterium]|nr:cell division protein SepF [Clostridia bacterium]
MAKKFFNKMLDAIGLEEQEDEYFDEMEPVEEEEEEVAPRSFRREPATREYEAAPASRFTPAANNRNDRKGKVINHPMADANAKRHQTMIYQFTEYEETRPTIDDLLDGHSVLINLDGLDEDMRQRVIDTFIGACYAINATIRKAAAYTYLLAPESVVVNGNYSDDPSEAKGPAALNK